MKMFVYSTIEYCATSWFERLRYIATYGTKDKYKTLVKMQKNRCPSIFHNNEDILKAHEEQESVRRTNLLRLLTSGQSLLSSRIAHVVASFSFSFL